MKYFALAALVGIISAKDTSKTWELRSVLQHRDEAVLQKQYGDESTTRANARPPMRSHVQLDEESAKDTTKSWELRSVLQHRDEAVLQKQYGDASTERANARPPMRSHVQVQSSSSSSSSSDDEDLQTAADGADDFRPGAAYDRVIPTRFTADSDDLFMRSMLNAYSVEVSDKEGVPTGVFIMDKPAARAAATEILATHKKMESSAIEAYLNTYFDKAWGHFDVNRTGSIAVYRTAELMRFLCSDQYMSLG